MKKRLAILIACLSLITTADAKKDLLDPPSLTTGDMIALNMNIMLPPLLWQARIKMGKNDIPEFQIFASFVTKKKVIQVILFGDSNKVDQAKRAIELLWAPIQNFVKQIGPAVAISDNDLELYYMGPKSDSPILAFLKGEFIQP